MAFAPALTIDDVTGTATFIVAGTATFIVAGTAICVVTGTATFITFCCTWVPAGTAIATFCVVC